MQRRVAKVRERVARTSGARGLAHRKELKRLEAELRELALAGDDAADVDAAIQARLAALYEAVEPEAELQGRAEKILLSLGFKADMIQVRSVNSAACSQKLCTVEDMHNSAHRPCPLRTQLRCATIRVTPVRTRAQCPVRQLLVTPMVRELGMGHLPLMSSRAALGACVRAENLVLDRDSTVS